MITIHFVIPKGVAPAAVKGVVSNYHYWSDGTSGVYYGVAYASDTIHPLDVVAALASVGVIGLPGVHDSTAIPSAAAAALSLHGVLATDTTYACATKMYAVSGIKLFRPHLY
jgi:hypothetical protein